MLEISTQLNKLIYDYNSFEGNIPVKKQPSKLKREIDERLNTPDT